MVIDDIIPQKPIHETTEQSYSMLGHQIFLAGRRRVPASLAFFVIALAAGAFTMFSWNASQLKFSSAQRSVITPSTSKAKESNINAIAPSAPANLTASAISSTQVNLSWNASRDNVGVTGYQIFRDGTKIGTSASTSYSDKTVSSGITYAYTVRAYDAENNISLVSNTASVTVPVQAL